MEKKLIYKVFPCKEDREIWTEIYSDGSVSGSPEDRRKMEKTWLQIAWQGRMLMTATPPSSSLYVCLSEEDEAAFESLTLLGYNPGSNDLPDMEIQYFGDSEKPYAPLSEVVPKCDEWKNIGITPTCVYDTRLRSLFEDENGNSIYDLEDLN